MLLILFCSCEKQRVLNVPFADTQYVINGLFNTNEPCQLEISGSQNLNDTNTVKDVSTANVLLFEDNRLIERLTYTAPTNGQNVGTYTSIFKAFQKAKEYSIEVEINGKPAITAADIIPTASASANNFIGPSTADTMSAYLNFELDLQQSNSNNQIQYFHLKAQQRWVLYSIGPTDTTYSYGVWFNKAIIPEQNPLGFITTPSEPFALSTGGKQDGIMLDNQQFVGLNKRIKFIAKNNRQSFPNLYLETRLIVRTVSANYFKYFYSSSQYYRTKRTPLTEPVIIHNNINSGLGNFSGFLTDTSATISTFY